MTTDWQVTGDSTGIGIESPSRTRSHLDLVGTETVSGERHIPTLVTSGTRATGAAQQLAARGPRSVARTSSVDAKTRQDVQVLFDSCIANLDRALDLTQEFFLRNNALEHVKETLGRLWSMRSQLEVEFAEVVNLLQGVFLDRDVESLTDEHLHAVRRVFARLEGATVYDEDLANAVTMDLVREGIDVFRVLD